MNDRIEKVSYNENEQRIYINKDKYFEGISSEVWNYHIGGYQVLQKYLKDRKSRNMDDAPRYCRIVTALSKTIEIQEQIDEIYPELEKNLFNFKKGISINKKPHNKSINLAKNRRRLFLNLTICASVFCRLY